MKQVFDKSVEKVTYDILERIFPKGYDLDARLVEDVKEIITKYRQALREAYELGKEAKEEEQPQLECPKCGALQDDFDGFGFWYCPKCKYCRHASYTGGKCDNCGEEESQPQSDTICDSCFPTNGTSCQYMNNCPCECHCEHDYFIYRHAGEGRTCLHCRKCDATWSDETRAKTILLDELKKACQPHSDWEEEFRHLLANAMTFMIEELSKKELNGGDFAEKLVEKRDAFIEYTRQLKSQWQEQARREGRERIVDILWEFFDKENEKEGLQGASKMEVLARAIEKTNQS